MVKPSVNYKELSEELDSIILKLQTADVEIDEAVRLHKKAAGLIAQLEEYLKTAENTIKKVTKTNQPE